MHPQQRQCKSRTWKVISVSLCSFNFYDNFEFKKALLLRERRRGCGRLAIPFSRLAPWRCTQIECDFDFSAHFTLGCQIGFCSDDISFTMMRGNVERLQNEAAAALDASQNLWHHHLHCSPETKRHWSDNNYTWARAMQMMRCTASSALPNLSLPLCEHPRPIFLWCLSTLASPVPIFPCRCIAFTHTYLHLKKIKSTASNDFFSLPIITSYVG